MLLQELMVLILKIGDKMDYNYWVCHLNMIMHLQIRMD